MQTFVKYFVIFILTLLTYSFFLYYPINMYRKSFFCAFALFIIVPFFCFSESLAQCDFLYNSFIRDGYSPKKQSLDNTNNYNFPYNIILEPENVSQPSTKIFIKIEEALSIVTELEKIVEKKVFLELQVKVEKDWRKKDKILKTFGYQQEKE